MSLTRGSRPVAPGPRTCSATRLSVSMTERSTDSANTSSRVRDSAPSDSWSSSSTVRGSSGPCRSWYCSPRARSGTHGAILGSSAGSATASAARSGPRTISRASRQIPPIAVAASVPAGPISSAKAGSSTRSSQLTVRFPRTSARTRRRHAEPCAATSAPATPCLRPACGRSKLSISKHKQSSSFDFSQLLGGQNPSPAGESRYSVRRSASSSACPDRTPVRILRATLSSSATSGLVRP